MPQVVLHIGLFKTGTTFLQGWLALNHDILASAEIFTLSSLGAHRLAVEGLCDPAIADRMDVVSIRSAYSMTSVMDEMQRQSAARIVASSEYFHLASPEHLAPILRANGLQAKAVVCYLRRQDVICASGYSQAVKALGLAHPAENQAIYTELLDWNVLHRRWRDAFPEADMIFMNYDKVRSDLAGSFSRAIGAGGVETQLPAQRSNLSLSAEMTEVARLLNLHSKKFEPEKLLKLQSNYPFVPFGFSRDVTASFEAEFRPSNAEFAAAFGNEFIDYAAPGWDPIGEDLTGLLTVDRLVDLFHAVLMQSKHAA